MTAEEGGALARACKHAGIIAGEWAAGHSHLVKLKMEPTI